MKKLPGHIEAILFDLDGSLADSMWIWPELDRQFMDKYRLVAPPNFHEQIEGMSYTETARCFRDTFPTLRLSVEEIRQEWLTMTIELYRSKVKPKNGAVSFIRACRDRGIALGISSSNTRELIHAFLDNHLLSDFFDTVVTSCEVGRGKPAPDVYMETARRMKVSPDRCLVFEDVPKGIMAGKRAGMTVWAVYDDFTAYADEKKKELADDYITDFTEIIV